MNGKARDLTKLPLAEQQECFKNVFGTPDDLLDLPSRSFNLVLAMQDLRRFETADYDIWFLSQSNDKVPLECAAVFSEIAEKVLGAQPSVAQVASLSQAWNVVPYWRLLESFGPWAGDALAEFAGSFLRRLDRMPLDLSVASALASEAELDKVLKGVRTKLPCNFQPSLLVLVEGITETILLPKFLSLSGTGKNRQDGGASRDSDPEAMFFACGGANQLLRKYLHMRDITKLPILCVIDHDAVEQIETITGVLREIDQLHVWSVGEIEDTFSQEALLDSLNVYLQSLGAPDLLLLEDLRKGEQRTGLLNRLWRNRGLGDFDKVGFAEFHVSRLKQVQDVPAEGRQLMNTIKQMTTGKHGG